MTAMPPKQGCRRKHCHYSHNCLIDVNASDLRGIKPQKVQKETSYWVYDQINQKKIALSQAIREATGNPQEQEHIC